MQWCCSLSQDRCVFQFHHSRSDKLYLLQRELHLAYWQHRSESTSLNYIQPITISGSMRSVALNLVRLTYEEKCCCHSYYTGFRGDHCLQTNTPTILHPCLLRAGNHLDMFRIHTQEEELGIQCASCNHTQQFRIQMLHCLHPAGYYLPARLC